MAFGSSARNALAAIDIGAISAALRRAVLQKRDVMILFSSTLRSNRRAICWSWRPEPVETKLDRSAICYAGSSRYLFRTEYMQVLPVNTQELRTIGVPVVDSKLPARETCSGCQRGAVWRAARSYART